MKQKLLKISVDDQTAEIGRSSDSNILVSSPLSQFLSRDDLVKINDDLATSDAALQLSERRESKKTLKLATALCLQREMNDFFATGGRLRRTFFRNVAQKL